MTIQNAKPDLEEREAARASDLEQKLGHGGNLRDAGAGAELPPSTSSDEVGSSGHVPGLEEINPAALEGNSGSSGADADRRAAERGE